MKRIHLAWAAPTLALLLSAAPRAGAADDPARTYSFGTHTARTNITFISEADLETIQGSVHAVSGTATYDPKKDSATGRFAVPVKEMRTGIDLRDSHMRGEQGGVWLEAAKYPEIVLEVTKTTPVKDAKSQYDYEGKLTIHGVTKDVKGRALIRFIPASVAGPARLGEGDWVRVKTDIDVAIEDYGIKIPEGVGPKVSKTWKVGIDLYGTTAPPPPK